MNKTLLIFSLITFLGLNVTYAGADESCESIIIYKDRIKEVEKEIYFFTETIKKVDVTRKNRLSLLIGNSPSNNLYTRTISPFTTQITRPDENVVGVVYSRDLGRLVFSAIGLSNDTIAIGIGINW